MGNQLAFDILPFDPTVTPSARTQLPIDLENVAHELRTRWPNGQVRVTQIGEQPIVRLYISTEQEGPWVVAEYTENPSFFWVSGWPKRIAKELILWYRHYVPMNYPLFLIIREDCFVTELTERTTLDDLENMYPYPVADE